MVQRIFGIGLGATGIVGTLIIAGILLQSFKISTGAGDIAVKGGVLIGIIFGILGIFGIAKRLF